MGIIWQKDLFGGEVVAPDVVERVKWVLAHYPEARDSYAALMIHYWLEFDGLDEVVPAEMQDELVAWFVSKATAPKTIQNRGMEVQKADAELAPSVGAKRKRARQAVQGRVR